MATDERTDTGGGLRMAAYDASDGRRVVIFGPMDGDFSKLRGLLAQLGDGTNTMADLHDQSFVEAADGVRLTLVADERAIAGVRRLDKGASIYVWTNSSETWADLAFMLDGVVDSTTACHQYLSVSAGDEALVVVSKGEYGEQQVQKP